MVSRRQDRARELMGGFGRAASWRADAAAGSITPAPGGRSQEHGWRHGGAVLSRAYVQSGGGGACDRCDPDYGWDLAAPRRLWTLRIEPSTPRRKTARLRAWSDQSHTSNGSRRAARRSGTRAADGGGDVGAGVSRVVDRARFSTGHTVRPQVAQYKSWQATRAGPD